MHILFFTFSLSLDIFNFEHNYYIFIPPHSQKEAKFKVGKVLISNTIILILYHKLSCLSQKRVMYK